MSDKPRVYQGVRVKTTVKELLQRHRAREANRKKVKTVSQTCSEFQALFASTLPRNAGSYVEASTTPIVDPSTCGAPDVEQRHASFSVPDMGCINQAQESGFACAQQPFGDMMVPADCYGGNNNSGGLYGAHPPPSFPTSWREDLASDSDNYGQGLAPSSSPESLKLYSPLDPNSYSPQDSFSSSSTSSCYDSPTRMECNFISHASEHYHSQNCTLQDFYCLPQCWTNPQESFYSPEYSPYYPPTDYAYPCLVEENYSKSNFAMNTEMCYNVL
ncbi:colorectal cancer associated 2 [Stigmatopora argus]